MSEKVRRVTFNLSDFISELSMCLESEDRHGDIDDVVQTYKDFLSHIDEDLSIKVRSYMNKRPELRSNRRLKSFVSACYK
jgi:hypothetical protein